MPEMMPFSFFSMLLILFNVMNYYHFNKLTHLKSLKMII